MKYKNLTIEENGTVKEGGVLVKPRGGKYFVNGEWLSAFTMMARANEKTTPKTVKAKLLPIKTNSNEQKYVLQSPAEPLNLKTRIVYSKSKKKAAPKTNVQLPPVQLKSKSVQLKNVQSNKRFAGFYIVNSQKYDSAQKAADATGNTLKNIQRWCKNKKNNCDFIPK